MDARTYYSDERIADAVVRQCRHRYVALRSSDGEMRRHYSDAARQRCFDWNLSCWPGPEMSTGFVEIHRVRGAEDPTALQYHVERGLVEVIPEVSIAWDLERSPILCIDLDPKFDMKLDDLKGQLDWIARAFPVGLPIEGAPVVGRKVRFSGNRSLHLWLALERPVPMAAARLAVEKALMPLVKSRPILTLDVKQDGRVVYVDTKTIAKHRCVRCLYSLHLKTGLCCVPVFDLHTFQREHATPEEVLRIGPQQEVF